VTAYRFQRVGQIATGAPITYRAHSPSAMVGYVERARSEKTAYRAYPVDRDGRRREQPLGFTEAPGTYQVWDGAAIFATRDAAARALERHGPTGT
jgi:hypothetical protein